VNITSTWAHDSTPAWSPDGAKIAFVSDRDGQPELYVMKPDGTEQVRLTNGVGFMAARPAWSPDGVKIAFNCMIESGNSDICVVDADGTLSARLTTDPGADEGPSWSPDGTKIAFTCTIESGNSDICVINADGTLLARLTTDPAVDRGPAWSPNGT